MKKLLLLAGMLLALSHAIAQGIAFQPNESWERMTAHAKAVGKPIFIDCYASWCVPCRKFEQNIFTDPQVEKFYNENYLCYRIQFDSAGKENPQVRAGFAIARKLEKEYGVRAFPTFMFFDSSGNPISKEVAPVDSIHRFLALGRHFLEPGTGYFRMKRRFAKGDSSTTLVKALMAEAIKAQDWQIAYALHDRYVTLLAHPWQPEELVNVYTSIENSNSKGFRLLLDSTEVIDRVLNDGGRVPYVIKGHLSREAYERFVKDKKSVDWKAVTAYLQARAPKLSAQILMEMQVDRLASLGDWEGFGRLKMDYYDRYAKGFDHNGLYFMNNELVDIFNRCSDRTTLKRAAQWSLFTLEQVFDKSDAGAMDTYANLLYKAGELNKALEWQKKAVAGSAQLDPVDQKEIRGNLDKMKKGQPTWSMGKDK